MEQIVSGVMRPYRQVQGCPKNRFPRLDSESRDDGDGTTPSSSTPKSPDYIDTSEWVLVAPSLILPDSLVVMGGTDQRTPHPLPLRLKPRKGNGLPRLLQLPLGEDPLANFEEESFSLSLLPRFTDVPPFVDSNDANEQEDQQEQASEDEASNSPRSCSEIRPQRFRVTLPRNAVRPKPLHRLPILD